MDKPTEYDPRWCALQDETLKEVITRVQALVNEYHEGNVTTALLKGDINLLVSRVPVDLPVQLATLQVKQEAIFDVVRLLRGQVYAFAFIIIAGFVAAVGGLVYQGIRR
jgi:hypothetical protein